jgi:hypothetical protein
VQRPVYHMMAYVRPTGAKELIILIWKTLLSL